MIRMAGSSPTLPTARQAGSRGRLALGLVAAIACAAAWIAPTAARGGDAGTGFGTQVSVDYVFVPVLVRSPRGHVRNLERDDFRLRVDGRPTPFATFDTGATAPVSVVFLQDLSGSMANGGKLEASREAIRYFLDRARPGDEFALSWFAGDIFEVDVPFGTDLGTAREVLGGWVAYGTTALHDAIARLPRIAPPRSGVKRAVILITDGVDNASTIPAEQARALIHDAELPVYVLGLGSREPAADGEEDVWRFAELLELLAVETGGRYVALDGPAELARAGAEILEDLRHQYVLGFYTGDGPPGDHRLEVEVAGRRERALSFRRGYHGGEPLAASTDKGKTR
jgi:VWFA-related protein